MKFFLTDSRIEIDNKTVERTIRPIALNRKSRSLRAMNEGAENWATIASIIETCKLDSVDPQAYVTVTPTAIVNGHKQGRIDELLPWDFGTNKRLKSAVGPLQSLASARRLAALRLLSRHSDRPEDILKVAVQL